MKLRTVGAILKKDVRSLYPLVLLTALLFAVDVLLTRLDVFPAWPIMFQFPVLLLAGTVLIMAVFQADSPVSLVDDWLCRPVPRAELLTAKLALIFAAVYLSRVLVTLVISPLLGASLAETVQEAFLLTDPFAPFLLPVLLFTALITRTIVQGIGVLLAAITCVLVIPTPFVSAPGPLQPAIGDALLWLGLGWLSVGPATLVPIGLFALGCWLAYWRRNTRAARVLLGSTLLLMLSLLLLPMWLLPWKPVFAAQQALAPPSGGPADTGSIYLRNTHACLPATRLRDVASDPAFSAARDAAGVYAWSHEDLTESNPHSVALLTSAEALRLPLDWRVKPVYVQATYQSPTNPSPLYSLRPTSYLIDSGGNRLSHAWVLPEKAAQHLSREPGVSLHLRYYLVLLEPHPFRLPVDGRRHAVPRLGFCSARPGSTVGNIDVDCFAGFDQPAQVSAELEAIPASRVYGPPAFSPGWIRAPFGNRIELSLGSTGFSQSDHITVIAWTLAGYLDEQLEVPGILGGGASSCPLPVAEGNRFQQSVWRDTAPHEVSSIVVDRGVQLEVLDFGGSGSPLVLLAGLGATAHSYDELAPLLAQTHRVIAITRRGSGYSSKPNNGFDTPRLAQDVLQVMDALKLGKVLLVGHSIAGEELTWLGGHQPERFSGLVYLDAAYDRSAGPNDRLRELNGRLPPEPPFPPEALRNYQAMSRELLARGHERLPEGELIAFRNVDKPFLAGSPAMDARTYQAILAAVKAPDYAALKIPALGVFAFESPDKPPAPWYDANDPEQQAIGAEIARILQEEKRRNIEAFRRGVAHGQVLELQNSTHWLIQSSQREVVEAIQAFSRKIEGYR